ncbi:hypothetical protein PCASD_22603 [Puccinia coronata f. sp. avenae]|uniref:Uncharacterized protein n=1 Tax=Puccinia coronata f. sp. avenae TaxID=200324 RepID=A0A2N5TRE5_9BASI|nr:hypothetical protein PCASD_22603 [Puccinia coronata f. sp. avenae]
MNYTGSDVLPGLPVIGPYAGNIPIQPNGVLPPLPDLPVAPVPNHQYPLAPPQMLVGRSPVFVQDPASPTNTNSPLFVADPYYTTPANCAPLTEPRVNFAAQTADLACTATGPQDAPSPKWFIP